MISRGVLGIALVLALAPRALADESPKQRAAKLLDEGVAQFEEGRAADAYASFQAAYRLYPSSKILLNMGQALKALGRNAEAAQAYERFLVEMSALPEVGDRRVSLARAGLAEVLPRIGRLHLEVSPPDAVVSLDGASLGPASRLRTLYVEPGEHRLTATAAGFRDGSALASATAGYEQRVSLALEAIPPEPAAPVVAEAPPPAPRRRWTWVAAGSSAAFLAGGVGVWLHARSLFDEYRKTDSGPRWDELRQDIGREKILYRVLFGAAGVAAITAGTLYYYEGSRRREVRVGFLATEREFCASAGWTF
jgi:tetratricopeptide (TPR) repeat protein